MLISDATDVENASTTTHSYALILMVYLLFPNNYHLSPLYSDGLHP